MKPEEAMGEKRQEALGAQAEREGWGGEMALHVSARRDPWREGAAAAAGNRAMAGMERLCRGFSLVALVLQKGAAGSCWQRAAW